MVLSYSDVADSVNIANLAKKSAAFILNDCKATSNLTREAQDAHKTYEVPIAPITWGSRVAFISSLKYGQGVLEHDRKARALRRFKNFIIFSKNKWGNDPWPKHKKNLADALNELVQENVEQKKPAPLKTINNTSVDEKPKTNASPSRVNKKHLGGYVDLATWQQWNILRIELDGRTTQAMLEEAINDLFIKYGKSSIA